MVISHFSQISDEERVSRPWSHPVVLNMGPLDWESSALITKPVIYNQLSEYSDSFLNNVLCGFRKAHSTQHALLKLLQSWQQVLDTGAFISTILMDLSKTYDRISQFIDC